MSTLANPWLHGTEPKVISRTGLLIALWTLWRREVRRFFKLWKETLMPSAITTFLYFLIFGHVMGPRIGSMHGVHYIQFIFPGLMMLSLANNAYCIALTLCSSPVFKGISKNCSFQPMPDLLICIGYCCAGALRGMLTAIIVTLVARIFTPIPLVHPGMLLLCVFLAAGIFSTAGFCNGLIAKDFDMLSSVSNFIITPLTYLAEFFILCSCYPLWAIPWHCSTLLLTL